MTKIVLALTLALATVATVPASALAPCKVAITLRIVSQAGSGLQAANICNERDVARERGSAPGKAKMRF
jgi:hypothetical protein